jgi:ribosomal protein S18 acetylase RimI-like enzyme
MSKLTVDRARPADAAAVETVLDAAAAWQQSRGIGQWTPGQFGDEVRDTIENGALYVARRDSVIIGCFMLDEGSPRMTQWLIEHGRESRSGLNVGRLAVAPEASGEGLGVKLLDEARTLAAGRGATYLWLDCPAENTRLRRYYVDAGFSYCGDYDIVGPNGEPWVSSVFELHTGM